MQIRTLTCPDCGAPIQVPLDADTVTCSYCGSKIRVDTTNMDAVMRQLREVENDNALMRLDQDWDAQSEQFMIRTNDGDLIEPTPFSPNIVFLLSGVIILLVAVWIFSPWPLSTVAIVNFSIFIVIIMSIVIALLWNARKDNARYKAYKDAEDVYQAQRDALIKQRIQQ